MRGWAAAFLVFLAGAVPAPAAQRVDNLYRTAIEVTGQREETRAPALRRGFRDVLAKVSGDPRLLDDARVDGLFGPAAIAAYSYRDLMAHLPKKDEQGTRDRPHLLTLDFSPAAIRRALASLGRATWSEVRPVVAVFVAVEIGNSEFVIADEGEPGALQRTSLRKAAERYGIPVVFPSRALIETEVLSIASLRSPDIAGLAAAARRAGGDTALVGHMEFSDEERGWVCRWSVPSTSGGSHDWGIRGVNFDEAFRHAVRGTAQILSDNGRPN